MAEYPEATDDRLGIAVQAGAHGSVEDAGHDLAVGAELGDLERAVGRHPVFARRNVRYSESGLLELAGEMQRRTARVELETVTLVGDEPEGRLRGARIFDLC